MSAPSKFRTHDLSCEAFTSIPQCAENWSSFGYATDFVKTQYFKWNVRTADITEAKNSKWHQPHERPEYKSTARRWNWGFHKYANPSNQRILFHLASTIIDCQQWRRVSTGNEGVQVLERGGVALTSMICRLTNLPVNKKDVEWERVSSLGGHFPAPFEFNFKFNFI